MEISSFLDSSKINDGIELRWFDYIFEWKLLRVDDKLLLLLLLLLLLSNIDDMLLRLGCDRCLKLVRLLKLFKLFNLFILYDDFYFYLILDLIFDD